MSAIGTKQTLMRDEMSASGGKADIPIPLTNVCSMTQGGRDIVVFTSVHIAGPEIASSTVVRGMSLEGGPP